MDCETCSILGCVLGTGKELRQKFLSFLKEKGIGGVIYFAGGGYFTGKYMKVEEANIESLMCAVSLNIEEISCFELGCGFPCEDCCDEDKIFYITHQNFYDGIPFHSLSDIASSINIIQYKKILSLMGIEMKTVPKVFSLVDFS